MIKGGTIVTADLTYQADVLIDGGTITAIGKDLKGDKTIDATGCYVMPGGIDPHTHLEMPFMGTQSADDFSTGTQAAISGGTTMVVDFVLPGPNQSLLEALQTWHQKAGKATTDYSFHMAVTWWGEQVWNEMAEVVDRGINTFKHFMAYKGALMVNDDEMYESFLRCAELGALPLVHAENGDVVARLQQKLHGRRQQRPGRPCLFAPARGRGRGDQPRHHDRRHGRRAALCRPHLLRGRPMKRSAAPGRWASASTASR